VLSLFKIQLPDAVSKNGLDLNKDFKDFSCPKVQIPKPRINNCLSS